MLQIKKGYVQLTIMIERIKVMPLLIERTKAYFLGDVTQVLINSALIWLRSYAPYDAPIK